jgi:hypothetical protein
VGCRQTKGHVRSLKARVRLTSTLSKILCSTAGVRSCEGTPVEGALFCCGVILPALAHSHAQHPSLTEQHKLAYTLRVTGDSCTPARLMVKCPQVTRRSFTVRAVSAHHAAYFYQL